MDDNRILTNKIFKQKINELVGADVIELEAANDDLALNCKIFEAGMDAIKGIISGGGSLVEHTLDLTLDWETIVPLIVFTGDDFPAWPTQEKQVTGVAIVGDATAENGPLHNKIITDVKVGGGGGAFRSVKDIIAEPMWYSYGCNIPVKPIVVTLNGNQKYTIIFYTGGEVTEIESSMDVVRVHYIEYAQEEEDNA